MNKYMIIVLMFLSVLGLNGNNSEAGVQASPRSKEQIKKSVVKITSQGRQGTGFIVGLMRDTAYILTVSHVVASDLTPKVEFFGQPLEFKAKILASEGQQENGFALLTVTGSIPSDTIPLYVANNDLEQGDSVFTFGFPLNGGDWAYDELSYSSRIAREILFSGSDMEEGNSGSPLIKGDEVVGMVTSVTKFAYANSSASIREFLRGAKGGNIVLEQMGKWGVNWHEAYDKHLKETSMLAEQQPIIAASDDELVQLRKENERLKQQGSKAGIQPIVTEPHKKFKNCGEIVEKVQEAAEYLAKTGDVGLADFKGEKSRWAWKDTYVFVYNCKEDKILAHPTLEGKPFLALKDKMGKEFFKDLCRVGESTRGGWVNYMWKIPGEEGYFQKITYATSVKGTLYQVAAGIYDSEANVDDLNRRLFLCQEQE